MIKNSLISSLVLFVFTGIFYLYQNSKLVLGEYERICHNAYDTKVWLDTCFGPYYGQLNTLLWSMKIEVVVIAVLLIVLFVSSKTS